MTPLNREKYPRSCCFCAAYRVPAEIVLVRIEWPEDRTRHEDKRYTEVPEGYSGIRSICTTCLDGLSQLVGSPPGRSPLGPEDAETNR